MPGFLMRLRAWFGARRAAQEKFRRIFEQSPDLVALIDWRSGRYVDVNRVFEARTGFRADEVIGRTPLEMGLVVNAEAIADIAAALKREGAVQDHPYVLRTRAGELRQCRVAVSLFDLDGVPHTLTVSRDVTGELRAAEAQRERDTLLGLSLGAAHMGTWMRDLETDTYTWSQEAADILGRRLEDMPKTLAESASFLVPEDVDSLYRAAQTADDGTYKTLLRVARPDGAMILVETQGCVLVGLDGRRRRYGVIADVTERETAALALRASESRFSRLFNEMPSAVSLVRIADVTLLAVNRGWEQLYGLRRDEVLGRTSAAFNLWPDAGRRDAFFSQLREAGSVREFEAQLRCAGGAMRTVMLEGREIEIEGGPCWLLVGHDISERQAAEGAREESETLLRLALEAAQMGVWRRDIPDGRLEWSPAMFRIFGVEEQAFGGYVDAYLDRIHPADRGRVNAEIGRITSDAKGLIFIEHRILRPDGGERWVEVRGRTILDAADRPVRRIGTVLDITERKAAEIAVRRENLLLEARVAMRTHELEMAVGELESFSYTVAHDLRAPLRAVAGFGAMLREDYGAQLAGEGTAMLDRMTGAAERLSEMIDALLELSRIMRTPLERRRVDLSAIAQSIAADLCVAEPQRRVEFDIAPGLEVEGDPRLLRLVLENLLGNAWKYSSRREQARIGFGAVASQPGARNYYVRDNGAGFEPQYASKLFGVFQRLHTPAEFPGHGVGLSTVKRIIERHGGTVRAEGARDAGATFYFSLPEAVPGRTPPARAAT